LAASEKQPVRFVEQYANVFATGNLVVQGIKITGESSGPIAFFIRFEIETNWVKEKNGFRHSTNVTEEHEVCEVN
jgi:hypothetical protein